MPYVTEALGTRFEVEALGYKPYPCGVVIHPALDAALAWFRAHGQDSDAITGVRLQTHPSALALGFRRHPTSVLEAKVSLYHWVAAALAQGRAGIAQGQQAALVDAEVVRLREIIQVDTDAAIAPDAAVLTVVHGSGRQQMMSTSHCKGSIANPMSDEDLAEKFCGQAEMRLPSDRSAKLLERCWKLDQLRDAAEIAALARAS
jgi:2-methylcitrate dehydratase PrpD